MSSRLSAVLWDEEDAWLGSDSYIYISSIIESGLFLSLQSTVACPLHHIVLFVQTEMLHNKPKKSLIDIDWSHHPLAWNSMLELGKLVSLNQ